MPNLFRHLVRLSLAYSYAWYQPGAETRFACSAWQAMWLC